jgi:lipopolysaccharide export system permease protein
VSKLLPLYVYYIGKHYLKNLLIILLGISFAFATIDFFINMQSADISSNLKVVYLFYKIQEALGLLYPLCFIFALIVTKLMLVKNNTMVILHSFGYNSKKLFLPILGIVSIVYGVFMFLHTTEFSFAKDKAELLLKNKMDGYSVDNLFFKYHDTFVYIKKLDPIQNKLEEMTLFKVSNNKVDYTIEAPKASFDGTYWYAKNATLKTHRYDRNDLIGFDVEKKETIRTLEGYKPTIMESFNKGNSLNIIDTYKAIELLEVQGVKSDNMRSRLYTKVFTPLFSFALILILFFKLPNHARVLRTGVVTIASLGATLFIWAFLFGLSEIAENGVISPEFSSILPVTLLLIYALIVYFKSEKLYETRSV